MIIVLGGIKGGSGKTTLATNLAQLKAFHGYKVLLVDADEQQSAWDWAQQRDQAGLGLNNLRCDNCAIVTVCMTGKSVYSNLIKMKADYDDIIVDTGGRDTTSQRAALCAADKLLMPFKPSSIDIWTVGGIGRMLHECTNYNLKSFAIINQADFKGKDNDEALKALQSYDQITCLDCHIGNRKAFRNAAADGKGVFEIQPVDQKACNEIRDLYERIF